MKTFVEAAIVMLLVSWGILRGVETALQYWVERSVRSFRYQKV